ncbi:MAG TPA: uroporphyrinogen decarboxylase [Firmicutes bacterium]|nr:uroporphyrinogen decarboxylase [Bacillota bacterium]
MKDAEKRKQERTKLFEDIYDGIIPARVPVMGSTTLEFAIQYAGLPLAETQWTLEGMEVAFEKVCQMFPSDQYPIGFFRSPAYLQILGSRSYVMGSNGFLQHPEIVPMDPGEYDELIENPIDFYYEKIQPRVYTELDTDPISRSFIMAQALLSVNEYNTAVNAINKKLVEKYGYYVPPQESTGPLIFAPFDYIADWLRGFTGALTDMKRYPEKVLEACESVLAVQLKAGIPDKPSKYGSTHIPLHMATYMGDKEFEKFYWPTFSKLLWGLADAGQPAAITCQNNWMRYLDYLQDLPPGTRISFEYGDPQLVKDKLGKKHILSGFYPIGLLKNGSKQQCIDKAKELLDILAPGGRYFFKLDKALISLDSINPENYRAVLQYVSENATYDNAGEHIAVERTVNRPTVKVREIKSKYFPSWDEYKERHPNIDPKLEPIIKEKLTNYQKIVSRFAAH